MSIQPGHTHFTRMPAGARSMASDRDQATAKVVPMPMPVIHSGTGS